MQSRNKDRARSLLSIAETQAGYFTAKQAYAAGYSRQRHDYHAARGNWERIHRGIYRLRDYPAQPREDLAVLTLLSHNRAGEQQAVVSHDSALALHELSDIDPAKTHLTVPPHFRKRMPENVVLHTARLSPPDWEERDGYRVTTPLRTLLDAAGSSISPELLNAAVRDALYRGLVRERRLVEARLPSRARKKLMAAIGAGHSAAQPS